jgi:hypothetical protein
MGKRWDGPTTPYVLVATDTFALALAHGGWSLAQPVESEVESTSRAPHRIGLHAVAAIRA